MENENTQLGRYVGFAYHVNEGVIAVLDTATGAVVWHGRTDAKTSADEEVSDGEE